MRTLMAALSLGVVCTATAAQTNPMEALIGRFEKPGAEFRIHKIIHSWPDESAAQDALMARLQTQGFGGVVCNVSFQDYLRSEDKWEAFTRAVKAAHGAGMAMWLYDERGYPSAAAGGLVLRDNPEWEAEGLLIADTETSGQPVEIKAPPGKLVFAAAFPVHHGVIDLERRTNLAERISGGTLRWEPADGTWRAMVVTRDRLFDGTHAEMNLHEKLPYPNLLRPESTARFLALTHQEYARRLGTNLGAYFLGTFTDEPSLMSLFLRPMPYRVLPWSPELPRLYQERHGFALEQMIPVLVADAGGNGQRHRYQFWNLVGELTANNFFGQIQEWCAKHQIPSGGHLLMEEGMVAQVPLYGDFLRCARRLDAPSIDCLTSVPSQVPWQIARLISGAAELEGKTLVMCETSDHSQRYRPKGDQRSRVSVSEAEIRGTCNRLFVGGVNDITSYYSFADLSDAALRRLNEYVGRCCTLLRGGSHAAEIALLYPTQSLWPRFRPAHHWANEAPAAMQIETTCRNAAEALFKNQRDFTFVDGRAVVEGRVREGMLTHGALRWQVVVLPAADTLPLRAWQNLAQFVQEGGIVIALTSRPANSEDEFPSKAVGALANEMFGDAQDAFTYRRSKKGGAGIFLPAGSEALLPVILAKVLPTEVAVEGTRAPVRVTHRRMDQGETYFVINDSAKPWSGSLRFAANGTGHSWDPISGKVVPLASNHLPVELEPFAARAYQFELAKTSSAERKSVPELTAGGLTTQALPVATPEIAKGEFVRSGPIRKDENGRWQFATTLSKGGVDTFFFARWIYPQGLDLSRSDFLVLDTWVPSGQTAGAQLLVMLREKNGGDFLAQTGRALSRPGVTRTVVALRDLQLAGWSKDADGEVDLTQVDEVRVGWGGYFGKEGERVEFRAALPNIGTIK